MSNKQTSFSFTDDAKTRVEHERTSAHSNTARTDAAHSNAAHTNTARTNTARTNAAHTNAACTDAETKHVFVTPPPALERDAKRPHSNLLPLLMRGDHDTLEEAARRALEVRLTVLLGHRAHLSITDNGHTMISSRRRGEAMHLRLHHMFLDADDVTVRALARYLTRTDRRASATLDAYIESNHHRIKKAEPRATRIRTRGRIHDLGDIFEELEGLHFNAAVEQVRVTWGRRPAGNRRRRRSIRLGTYVQDDQLIRIHPVLDQDWVPRFFVAYVVFHEMLHHVVPAPLVNGRKDFHSVAFRDRERRYEDYERALAWERTHLRQLLTS